MSAENAEAAAAPQSAEASPLTENLAPEAPEAIPTGPLTEGLLDEAEAAAPEDAAKPAAPEGYKLDLAELGEVDPGLEAEYRETAHKLGLTQGQAQSLAAMYGAKLKDESKRAGQTFQARLAEQVKAWNSELKAAPDYKDAVADSRHALAKFGDKDFLRLLDESGMGSHPAFVGFVRRVGKFLREPGMVEGQKAAAGKMSFEEALWGRKEV